MNIKNFWKAENVILDLLYPPRCPICDQVAAEGACICEECRKMIHRAAEPVCKKCGKPIQNTRGEYCGDCMKKCHDFTQGKALWVYEEKVKNSIYRFKYQNRRDYARVYAREMVEAYGGWIRSRNIQAIVPIPLHRDKKRQRGFNQAEVLAVELGRLLGIPVERNLLIRTRNTRPQKELNNIERKNNLKKALKIRENVIQLKYILIVDDIYTTGSTIDAAASLFREAGAAEIYFCCIGIGKGF